MASRAVPEHRAVFVCSWVLVTVFSLINFELGLLFLENLGVKQHFIFSQAWQAKQIIDSEIDLTLYLCVTRFESKINCKIAKSHFCYLMCREDKINENDDKEFRDEDKKTKAYNSTIS